VKLKIRALLVLMLSMKTPCAYKNQLIFENIHIYYFKVSFDISRYEVIDDGIDVNMLHKVSTRF
jgi:hypothetical protein